MMKIYSSFFKLTRNWQRADEHFYQPTCHSDKHSTPNSSLKPTAQILAEPACQIANAPLAQSGRKGESRVVPGAGETANCVT